MDNRIRAQSEVSGIQVRPTPASSTCFENRICQNSLWDGFTFLALGGAFFGVFFGLCAAFLLDAVAGMGPEVGGGYTPLQRVGLFSTCILSGAVFGAVLQLLIAIPFLLVFRLIEWISGLFGAKKTEFLSSWQQVERDSG
jgi:hypothetical protein